VLYPINDSGGGFLVLGDFNGDGILDVAAPGNTRVWLFTGKADGTFNPGVLTAALTGSLEIAAADFNGDHNLDLVVSLTNGGVDGEGAGFVVLLGNGNGTFQAPKAFPAPKEVTALVAGNLTKGGYPGIALATNANSYVYLYTGNGAGGFSGPTYIELPEVDRDGLTLGDVNGDGIPDLISSGAYVAYGIGGGHFAKPISYTVSEARTDVVLADLQNNGRNDIVTSGYYVTSVLLNEGKEALENGLR
jgi:hypothetical protein